MINSIDKFNLYIASKHLSSLIPLTTIDEFVYNDEKSFKQITPNLFKDKHNHTFRVRTLLIERITKNVTFDLPSYIKEVIHKTVDIFPDLFTSNVTKLSFVGPGGSYKRVLTGRLPQTLKSLHLPKWTNTLLSSNDLPNTLEELNINGGYCSDNNLIILPLSLKRLTLKFRCDQLDYKIASNFFPCNLQHLIIIWDNLNLKNTTHINEEWYPSNLLSLELHNNYKTIIDISKLPRTLEKLILPDFYTLPLVIGSLPPKLKILALGYGKYTLDKSLFPACIEQISLKYWNAHDITTDTFPDTLKKLSLDYFFKKCILGIPSKLEELILDEYKHKLDPEILPSTLKILYNESPRFMQNWTLQAYNI
jgi:hypothetical protein